MNARLTQCVLAIVLAALALPAQGVVLTFDASPALTSGTVPQDYGDNVITLPSGGSNPNPNYIYGTTYGATPDITVDYAPAPPATNILQYWSGPNFGDLLHVLYKPDNSGAADAHFSITLTAENGDLVSLKSLDLAANHIASPTLSALEVIVDGTPHVVDSNVAVDNTLHNSFDFTADHFIGTTVEIYLDGSSNVGDFGFIAIDNIAFAEMTPEPASLALLAGGSLLLLRRRRV